MKTLREHGRTAAELIKQRADSSQPRMGITTWANAPDGKILKTDAVVAKNYLTKDELESLGRIVTRTLTEQMREQSRYLRNHGRARQALKEVVETPDHQADRILRSIEQNNGELSNALAKKMPILNEPGVWVEIVKVVSLAFQEEPPRR